MNSNGGSASGNFSDHSRSTSNRYRGGSRRSRGRGNNERLGNQRIGNQNQKERRSMQSWRDSGKQAMDEQIDLGDSSQWPSIQEISKSESRGRHSVGQIPEKNAEQEINQDYAGLYKGSQLNTDENCDNNENKNIITTQRGNSHLSSGNSQNANFGQYNNNAYGNRQNNERYLSQNMNRGRGRFNNYPGNRYQGAYNRRFSKGYPSAVPGGVVVHPEVGPFFCPQAFEPAQYSSEKTTYAVNELGPVKQVEYYFSRANLVRDTFIRNKMDKDGWVSLREIYNFKRIQVMNIPFEEFVKILTSSEVLEIDTIKCQVRTRINPQDWVLKNDIQSNDQSNTTSAVSTEQNNVPSYVTSSAHNMQQIYPFPHYGYQVPVNYYPYGGNMQSNFRQFHQCQMYHQPVYGIPFNEMSHDMSGYYHSGQDYYGGYQHYAPSGYVGQNTNENVEEGEQNQASQKNESISVEQQPSNSTATTTTKEDEMEELSRKVSNIDVSNPPVSC